MPTHANDMGEEKPPAARALPYLPSTAEIQRRRDRAFPRTSTNGRPPGPTIESLRRGFHARFYRAQGFTDAEIWHGLSASPAAIAYGKSTRQIAESAKATMRQWEKAVVTLERAEGTVAPSPARRGGRALAATQAFARWTKAVVEVTAMEARSRRKGIPPRENPTLLTAASLCVQLERAWTVANYEAGEADPLFDPNGVIARRTAEVLRDLEHLATCLESQARRIVDRAENDKRAALRSTYKTTTAVATLDPDGADYRRLVESFLEPEQHRELNALLGGQTPQDDAMRRLPVPYRDDLGGLT